MESLFLYKSVWLFFFALQILVFSVLLLSRPEKASRWLGWFALLSSLYLCPWMFGHDGWYGKEGFREFLFFVPFQQFYFLGPVLFAYIRALLYPARSLSWRDGLHFLPGLFYLLYSIVVWVTDVWILDEYYFYADGRDKDLAPWYQITGLISMTAYLGGSLRLYQRYRKRIFAELSYAETVLFTWIRHFLWALLTIVILRLSFLVLTPGWGDFGTKFWYYLCFGILAYLVALRGYRYALLQTNVHPLPSLPSIADTPVPDPTPVLTAETAVLKQRLRQGMETEKWFESPTLTLTEMAERMQISTKQLSALINQGFGKNFNDFVNEYRVAAVGERLKAGEQQSYTLLSIALACGFNSKTTFNRVFKKFNGQTPRQYLVQLEEKRTKS